MVLAWTLAAVTATPVPAVPCTSTSGNGSNALYTLLGAGITAGLALLGIIVRYWLDRKSDEVKYQRELKASADQHARDLQKLKTQLSATRVDAIRDIRRGLAASYLSNTHNIYLALTEARRHRRESRDDAAYLQTLRAIEPIAAQVSLEEWRLAGSEETIARADQLWLHLRGHAVPRGHALGSGEWTQWKAGYWQYRADFVARCRRDLDILTPAEIALNESHDSEES